MLHIDFETFSELDVRNVGAYVYAEHPSTEVLMMSWAFGDEPVQLWTPDGPWDYDSMPRRVRRHLARGGAFCAHNVEFERQIFRDVLGIPIKIEQCRDTQTLSLTHGFPMSLDRASRAVGLEAKKDSRGTRLITKFCASRKPTKNNPATRWYPHDAPTDWEDFCGYCIQDTVVERAIWNHFTRV
jgi:DNA polymerase